MRMCDEMLEAEKKGDLKKCYPTTETPKIKEYCEQEFYDDIEAM